MQRDKNLLSRKFGLAASSGYMKKGAGRHWEMLLQQPFDSLSPLYQFISANNDIHYPKKQRVVPCHSR